MNDEIIYINFNDWESTTMPDFPVFDNVENNGHQLYEVLLSDEYCQQNKLCINFSLLDMSLDIAIAAPKEWVDKNCPELLTDERYQKFLFHTDKEHPKITDVSSFYGCCKFPEYKEPYRVVEID